MDNQYHLLVETPKANLVTAVTLPVQKIALKMLQDEPIVSRLSMEAPLV